MKIDTTNIRNNLTQFYQKPVAQVSLELFLSILAVIFFAILAIRPTLLTMADLIKEIEDKQRLDSQLSQKIAALSSVQSQYLALENRLEVIYQAIPDAPEFEKSLKIIEKIASENNLVISSIQVPEIPKEIESDVSFRQKERQNIPLTIMVRGNYTDIRDLVEKMKNSRKTFVVDSVIFSVSQERGNDILQATITAYIQYFGKVEKQTKK